MPRRSTWRRIALGLPTIFGLRKRGYFIPYRYAEEIAAPQRYEAVSAKMQASEVVFRRVLDDVERHRADLLKIESDAMAPNPRWNQDWFPWIDAAVLYTLIRHYHPARFIEVGSGHSTRFAARAVADGGLPTEIIAIDPAPRAAVEALPVNWQRSVVQKAERMQFDRLKGNDMLFIDSSHILMPGSDVDFLFTEVLPRLESGVLVHIHDIFLPDDYPEDWRWRGYNEQSAAALLVLGGGWDLIFSSHYVTTRLGKDVAATCLEELPRPEGPSTSLWLRKR